MLRAILGLNTDSRKGAYVFISFFRIQAFSCAVLCFRENATLRKAVSRIGGGTVKRREIRANKRACDTSMPQDHGPPTPTYGRRFKRDGDACTW